MIDLHYKNKHIHLLQEVLTYRLPTEGVDIYFVSRDEIFALVRQLYELLDEGEVELKH